jgi:hypothetical protein
MRQIKTIMERTPEGFDAQVNVAIQDLLPFRNGTGGALSGFVAHVRLSAWKGGQSVHGGDLRGGCCSHYRRA